MRALRRSTKTAMDTQFPGWQGQGSGQGGPSRYFMTWDGTKNRVHPYTTGTVLTVGILERPAPMDLTAADEPDPRIKAALHEHLPLAAVYYLLRLDGTDANLATAEKFLADFGAFVGGNNVLG